MNTAFSFVIIFVISLVAGSGVAAALGFNPKISTWTDLGNMFGNIIFFLLQLGTVCMIIFIIGFSLGKIILKLNGS